MAASPKKPAKRPVTSAVKRTAWLEQRLARGVRPTALVTLAVEEWGIGATVVWEMLREIKERWREESETKRPAARAEVLVQVDQLIERGYATKDLSAVAKGLALKSELHGLRLKAVVDTTAAASALSVPHYLTTPRAATTEPPAVESDEP